MASNHPAVDNIRLRTAMRQISQALDGIPSDAWVRREGETGPQYVRRIRAILAAVETAKSAADVALNGEGAHAR